MKSILIALMPCWMLVLGSANNSVHKNSQLNFVNTEVANQLPPPGSDDLDAGLYKIRAANTSDKYLDVDYGKRGETVRLNRIGNTTRDNIWRVKKVAGPLGGYTIESEEYPGWYLDADLSHTDENGCKVQLWNRTGPYGNMNPLNHGSPISTNQEWHISFVSGGKYRISNVKSDGMYLDAKDNGAADSRVKLWRREASDLSQMWVFEKIK